MTLVRFYFEKDSTTEVFAYFPQLNYNKHLYGITRKTCYAHLGQHSACHVEYAAECKEANKEAYADLLHELKGQGYDNLKVLNKN